MDGLQC